MNKRIYLSPPNIDALEEKAVVNALKGGWVAPVGPEISEFEDMLASYFRKRVLLLNSGTSALHLSLVLSGVKEGDVVLTSSLTFAACANVIRYQQANPVFLDSELQTWNMDPDVLDEYLAKSGQIPKAIIVTHLYGVPAQIERLKSLCDQYGIILIEDAAESLGARAAQVPVGTFGDFGIISFNGNKVVTTGGGGALICSEQDYEKGLHLATQANSGVGEYDHDTIGYNYRLSNVLAALGSSQFRKLENFLIRKREISIKYSNELSDFFDFPERPDSDVASNWLSVALFKGSPRPQELVEWLGRDNIEARKLWKPLHLHKAYSQYEFVGSGVSENLFQSGICLPSGTGLTVRQQQLIIDSVRSFFMD